MRELGPPSSQRVRPSATPSTRLPRSFLGTASARLSPRQKRWPGRMTSTPTRCCPSTMPACGAGRRSQSVQFGKAGSLGFIEQPSDAHALILVEPKNKALPQTIAGAITYAPDKAFESRDAGQQDFVGDKPGNAAFDQGTRMIVAAPTQRIEPTGQAKAGVAFGEKVREAVALLDRGKMALTLTASKIAAQRRVGLQGDLASQRDANRLRNFGLAIWKRPQKTRAAKHQSKAETIVIAAQRLDDLLIGDIKMKMPGELFWGRTAGKSSVSSPLFIAQNLDRHFSRNSMVLRSRSARRKIKALSLAKSHRETKEFRGRFCNGREVAA